MPNDAAKADPDDPHPHDFAAQVFQHLAKNATTYAAYYYREKAEDEAELARVAKGGDQDSKIRAQVLLESIHQDEFPGEESSIPEAVKAFREGEQFFGEKKFDTARESYKKAFTFDSRFAIAALYVGDCFHHDAKPLEAVAWFRKATEVRPDYPKAWRYLSDALQALGKTDEAESALLGGIIAYPGNRLTWLNLAGLRASRGKPMTKLAFRPGVTPSWDAEGQQTLNVPEKTDDPDGQAVWTILVASVMDTIRVDEKEAPKEQTVPPLRTRFQQELFFWNTGLEGLERTCQEKKQEPKDRILQKFLAFKRDGQLEAALFLLRYKEAFRPDFEAWKKKNPAGIVTFIDRYNIRP